MRFTLQKRRTITSINNNYSKGVILRLNKIYIIIFSLVLALGVFAAKTKMIHFIDQSVCTQCGKCIKNCPVEAIKVIKKDGKSIHEIDPSLCTQCGLCIEQCPEEAISTTEVKPDQGKDNSGTKEHTSKKNAMKADK